MKSFIYMDHICSFLWYSSVGKPNAFNISGYDDPFKAFYQACCTSLDILQYNFIFLVLRRPDLCGILDKGGKLKIYNG